MLLKERGISPSSDWQKYIAESEFALLGILYKTMSNDTFLFPQDSSGQVTDGGGNNKRFRLVDTGRLHRVIACECWEDSLTQPCVHYSESWRTFSEIRCRKTDATVHHAYDLGH